MPIIKSIITSLFGLTRGWAVSVSVAQATRTFVRDRRVRQFGNGLVLVTFRSICIVMDVIWSLIDYVSSSEELPDNWINAHFNHGKYLVNKPRPEASSGKTWQHTCKYPTFLDVCNKNKQKRNKCVVRS